MKTFRSDASDFSLISFPRLPGHRISGAANLLDIQRQTPGNNGQPSRLPADAKQQNPPDT